MGETLTLTPAMHDLLDAMPRDAARRIIGSCTIIFAILIPIVLIVEAVQRQFRFGVAVEFVGVCALIVLALGGKTFIERSIRRSAGLRDDTAIRYTGALSALWGGRTRPYVQIGDDTIHLEPFPLRERPTFHGLTAGTILYSRAGDLIFAIWDEDGRCLHRYPGFDPEGVAAPTAPAVGVAH